MQIRIVRIALHRALLTSKASGIITTHQTRKQRSKSRENMDKLFVISISTDVKSVRRTGWNALNTRSEIADKAMEIAACAKLMATCFVLFLQGRAPGIVA